MDWLNWIDRIMLMMQLTKTFVLFNQLQHSLDVDSINCKSFSMYSTFQRLQIFHQHQSRHNWKR